MIRLIVIGTIPAIVVGLLFNDYIEAQLRTPLVAAVALAVGAVVMLVAERVGRGTRGRDVADAGRRAADRRRAGVRADPGRVAVGVDDCRRHAARRQARAGRPIHVPAGDPGDPRRGAARSRSSCATCTPTRSLLTLFAVGALVSAVVGYVTIKYFLRFLAGHRLDVFAYYRLALAALTLVWLLSSR